MDIVFYHNFFPPWIIAGTSTKSLGDVSVRNIDARKKLQKILKIQQLACLNQKHSTIIKKVTGKSIPEEKNSGDGLWTKETDICLLVKSADCVPVLLADTNKKIIMALHAGRKGLKNAIIEKGLKILLKEGCSAQNIKVLLGPFIEKSCYSIDMEQEIKQQLGKNGINRGQIYSVNECTFCLTDKYYSYRRGDSERMGTFIYIDSRLPLQGKRE